MTTVPEIYVRDSSRATVGEVSEWSSLAVTQRLMDVGRWQVSLDSRAVWDLFHHDVTRGWPRGVVIIRNGEVLCSGWADRVEHQVAGGNPTWTVSGWDDIQYFGVHTSWPSPSQPIGNQGNFHTITGTPAETKFKIYAQANLIDRLNLPGLVIVPTQGRGGQARTRSRFRTILDIGQGIHNGSGAGMIFTAAQDFNRQIVIDARMPRDLTGVVQFSPDLDTAPEFRYIVESASATRAIVMAGDDTDRGLALRTNEPSIHRVMRPEIAVDARGIRLSDADWQDDANLRGDEALEENRAKASFVFSVGEMKGLEYGVDYLVGDTVRGWITEDQGPDDPRVDDVVTEVQLEWTRDNPGKGTIWLGPNATPSGYDAKFENDVLRRIGELERAV